jgi:hypothetical protein
VRAAQNISGSAHPYPDQSPSPAVCTSTNKRSSTGLFLFISRLFCHPGNKKEMKQTGFNRLFNNYLPFPKARNSKNSEILQSKPKITGIRLV